MWLLTTCRRPRLAQQTLDACRDMGMSSPGVVYIDGYDPAYEGLSVPPNWTVHVAEHAGLSEALRWCLASYPAEPCYGWLADDMLPRTPGWDRKLEEAAGSRCMSQADDRWAFARDPDGVRSGLEPSAGMCWGGELVRAVRWWALPASVQGGTDVAWCRLVYRLSRMRFCEDVVVEHAHWRTGKRERDSLDTDMHDANGHEHTERDIALLWAWVQSRDFVVTAERVRRLAPLPPSRRVRARAR